MPKAKAPDGKPSHEESQDLFAEMMATIPELREANDERWRVHELLAYLVTFHHRENKPVFWAKYERMAMNPEQLAEDPDCLAGLERTKRKPSPVKSSLVHEYRFDPEQETKLREGSKWIAWQHEGVKGEIYAFDAQAGLLEIKTTKTLPTAMSIIPDELVPVAPLDESIRKIARAWMKKPVLRGALADLLHRRPPKRSGHERGGAIIPKKSDTKAATIRAIAEMDGTILAIQGPPGAGKTHVGAAAIAHLLAQGLRVGITSHSHKVIEHLMLGVLAVTRAEQRKVHAVNVDRNDEAAIFDNPDVQHAASVKDVGLGTAAAPQLMGGTAWAFANEVAEGQFDYLFVDEAGQVSLANLVAMSPSARNIVLLGDQMQLSQPLKGVHPGESGTSALEYLITKPDGTIHQTIPPELGVFLPSTHRMHPAVCRFISDAIYEGRLEPEPHTKHRVVLHGDEKSMLVPIEAGIHFIPVDHDANVQESEEEVEVICEIVAELRGRKFREKEGAKPRSLRDSDILVVAPYNRQVNLLKEALPGQKVGTVDLFQGQEAPVVIISMCASSADDAPRGLEFLMSQRRLNVAISRAQSLAIIVGSPELTRTRVTSVGQMRLVNLFCRAVATT